MIILTSTYDMNKIENIYNDTFDISNRNIKKPPNCTILNDPLYREYITGEMQKKNIHQLIVTNSNECFFSVRKITMKCLSKHSNHV